MGAWGTGSNATIQGNPTINVTTTVGGDAYAIHNNANGVVTVEDATINVCAAGNGAAIVYTRNNATTTINGGTFDVTTSVYDADTYWGIECIHNHGVGATVNINGGAFTISNKSKIPEATYPIRSYGGTINITGNTSFTSQGYSFIGPDGFVQEEVGYVNIDGGTFISNYGPELTSREGTGEDVGKINRMDITIWDGKFKCRTGGYVDDFITNPGGVPAGNLHLRGGYFSKGWREESIIRGYVESPSTLETLTSGPEFEDRYTYHVTTKYNVTWSVAGTPTVQEFNRNEMPSYGSTPVYPGTDTYEFIGWDKEIVPVTEDVTYTAQFRKYEAEVLEGEAATGEKYENFADAWAYAENLPVATIKLLSNVSMASQLQYHPDSVETATTTLDLNNHILAYTGTEDRFLYTNKDGCKLIIKDSSVGQGGQLKAEIGRDGIVIAAATHYGALELQGGTIFSHNTSSSGSAEAYGIYPCRESSFTMTGGHIEAQSYKNVRGVFTETGSPTVHISGGSILATTEEAGVYGNIAYGVWANSGAKVTISGDVTVTAHANIESYAVVGTGTADKPAEVTIRGGEMHAIVEDQAAFGIRANEYSTIWMEGGSVEAHSNAENLAEKWNIEGAHCSGNAVLNISGGEISSSKGAMPIGVTAHGGTTTISGGKITSQFAMYAVDYPVATQTATVIINGGTFIGTEDAVRVEGKKRADIFNNANVVINGGYFYSEGWNFMYLSNEEGATPSTLVLKGGKYYGYNPTRTDQVLAVYKTEFTTINEISETVEGKTYVRELATPFTITWDGGSYNKVEMVNNGLTPANDELVGKTFIRNDSSFFFTHWSPAPVPVLSDATYRAVGDYYEARVTVGVKDSLFTEFAQAWEYAMTQATATVTLLSNIRRTEPITYCPAEANGRHTLDLNNFTISENTNDQILVVSKVDAKLTVTDNSAEKGGRLYKQKSSDANIYGVVVYTGEVILAGGTVYCENTIDNEEWHPAIGILNSMNENAKITVTGGTIESVAKKAAYGICSYGPVLVSGGNIRATTTKYVNARALSQQVGTATVTGGTFDAIATGTGTQLYTVMADAWVSEDGSTQEGTVNISGGTFNVHTDNSNAQCAMANAAIKNVGGTVVKAHGTMNISGGSFNAISSSPTYQSVNVVSCLSERVFDDATPHHILGESKGVMTITGGNFLLDTRDGSGNIVTNLNNTDLVRNWGTMDISGGTFTIYQNYSTAVANFRNKVTISGEPVFNVYARLGSVPALRAAAWCDANYCDADVSHNLAEIEVNGGTYKAVTAEGNAFGVWADGVLSEGDKYAMNAKITVNDGSFMVIAPHGDDYWPIAAICENDKVGEYGTAVSNIIVNGGKFMERSGTEAENTTFHATNVHDAGHVVLTGGYYELENRLSDYKADTCDVVAITSPEIDPEYNNGYRYKIVTHYEAKVTTEDTEHKFARFNDAWAYAMTQNNATITLLDNVTRTETINYNPSVADGRHTLDLNNFTITDNTTNEIMAINRVDAKLTITDNSLEQGGRLYKQKEGSGNLFGVSVYQGEVILAGGTVYCENTIDDKGWHPAIALFNAMTDDAIITVTGGRVESVAKISAYGICAYGPVAVSGGTIHANATKYSNARALSQQHNTATITGGTLEAIASNTATWASAVVADAYEDPSHEQHGTVNISGGTFSCSSTNSESYCALSLSSGSIKGSMTISGGKFRSNDGVITHSASGDLTVTGGYFNEKATGTSFRDQVASRVSAPYAVLDLSVSDPLYAEGYRYKVAEDFGFHADIVDVDNTNSKLILNATGWASGGWPYTVNGVEYQKTAREADRTLKIPYTGVPGDNFVLSIRKTGGDLVSSHTYVIPQEITSNTTISDNPAKPLYVKNGVTLTINGSISAQNIYVGPDATLVINSGKTLTADSIFLRTTASSSAQMENNGTIAVSTKVVYTRIIKDKDFHFFGLPLNCAISAVKLSDGVVPQYGSGWLLRSYDEARRAVSGADDNNWVSVAAGATISGGKGYEMYSASNYYREFYFPVDLSGLATSVPLAYSGVLAAGKTNAGWNALVSPLTRTYENAPVPEGLVVCWYRDGWYEQEIPEEIPAATAFVFQTDKAGALSFADDHIVAALPRRATDEETRIQWLNVDLEDADGVGDKTSIYAHPTRYDQAYQSGIDVAKQSLEASRAILYSTHVYGEMAFAGVADSVLESGVALTIYSPKEQELTFSMRENDWLNRMEYVWLIDHETGATTDLLYGTYTFSAPAGTTRGRFTIQGIFRSPQITTDLEPTSDSSRKGSEVRKVIINQKMYILRNGEMYDATGKRVNK